jgi:hypothetical protein
MPKDKVAKKRTVRYILVALFVVLQIAMVAVVLLTRQKTVANCPDTAPTQTIKLTDRGFSPKDNTVHLCTHVVFVNEDSEPHFPAFGEHDHHNDPAGFEEKTLAPGETNDFTPHTTGSLQFHDHFDDDSEGTLNVRR